MFNNLTINWWTINTEEVLTITPSVWTISSTSFSLNLLTKYAFKSTIWSYFNFNNFCITWRKYWNYIVNHNFDDIAESRIFKYSNSLRNWWVIFDKRYEQIVLDIEIIITSDNITNLENEIRDLKSALEFWGQCYKNEQNVTSKINVELTDFTVWRLKLLWTSIKIKMLSLDPFWTTENSTTVFNENNTWWSFSWSLNLSNTTIRWFVKHILYIKTVTWLINTMTLNIWWFPIIINETLINWTSIILDWINSEVLVNWTKVRYFWQFPELEINIPHALNVNFWWGWTVNNFDLYNIYLNQQL